MRHRFVLLLILAVFFGQSVAFVVDNGPSSNWCQITCRIPFIHVTSSFTSSSTTCLNAHRFNGGYDPASPLTWSPQQAAEFTIFHHGEAKYIGLQLRMAIQHWTGTDLAEFLTRLYLGQKVEIIQRPTRSLSSPWTFGEESKHQETKQKLVYEPQNVRTPQWKGLETREGVVALKDLLKEALSSDALDSREIARFAEAFLLKEYKWPRRKQTTKDVSPIRLMPQTERTVPEIVFEQDSFYTRGYATTFARILWWIRKEKSIPLRWDDFVGMVTLPEHENKEDRPLKLADFYQTLVAHTPLTTRERTQMVERLALGGWSSSEIPKFMSEILPDDRIQKNMSMLEDGSFQDIPSVAELNAANDKNPKEDGGNQTEGDDQSILDATEEQVLLVSTLKRATLSIRSEYDQLVQSYWKQVDIPNAKKMSGKEDNRESKKKKDATKSSVGTRS